MEGMRKQLGEEEMREIRSRKRRSDAGGNHKQYKHDGVKVGQYDLQGRLEREFDSLVDAAENNKVGATYQGRIIKLSIHSMQTDIPITLPFLLI